MHILNLSDFDKGINNDKFKLLHFPYHQLSDYQELNIEDLIGNMEVEFDEFEIIGWNKENLNEIVINRKLIYIYQIHQDEYSKSFIFWNIMTNTIREDEEIKFSKLNIANQNSRYLNLLEFSINKENQVEIRNLKSSDIELVLSDTNIKKVCANSKYPFFAVVPERTDSIRVFKINIDSFNFEEKSYPSNNYKSVKEILFYNISLDFIEHSLQKLYTINGSTNEIIQLMARVNNLNRRIQLGICEKPEFERNQIRFALISYIETLDL